MSDIGQGYTKADGRYANVHPITPAASAARTANGNGSSIELGDRAVARLKLDVTAASGTSPTLDVTVQTSRDGATWYTAGTFTQRTGVASEEKVFAIDRFVRASWTVGGTSPSFTFSVAGEAA